MKPAKSVARLVLSLLIVMTPAAAAAQVGMAPAAKDSSVAAAAPAAAIDPLRMWVEFGAIYGTAVVLYHFDGRHRHLDVSLREGVRGLLSPSRLRFDDNTFTMNNIGHPVGGLLYYGAPRINGASARRSFATLLAASVFWEQVVELQEIASINDHIATPISGWVLGEALFQNRLLFQRGESTWRHRGLGALFGAPLVLTEVARPRVAPRRAGATDAGGLPADVESRIRFHTGIGERRGSEVLGPGVRTEIGLQTEVQPIARRTAPGRRSGWISGTASTRLDMDFSFRNGGLVEWRTYASAVPAGWYHHNVGMGAAEPVGEPRMQALRGASLLVAPFGAFELHQSGIEGHLYMEQLAAYMLGAGVDAVLVRGRGTARAVLSGAATFANVSPTGQVGYPVERRAGESTVFRTQGYVHAWGGSLEARTTLEHGPVTVGATARSHHLRSFDGRDRMPAAAYDVQRKRERWVYGTAHISVRPVHGLELSAVHELARFRGSVADHSASLERHGWSLRAAVGW
jgi:hypothetical protein